MTPTGKIPAVSLRGVAAALALVLLGACDSRSVTGPDAGPAEFTLRVGEHRTLPSRLEVGFQRVTHDSRCPTRTTCIWEGMAVPRVWLLRPGEDSSFVAIEMLGSGSGSAEALGHRIIAVRLDPYPGDLDPIPESRYLLQLRIERLPDRTRALRSVDPETKGTL
ncbi:MAG TPA: hypothetical protein VEY91_07080 [Candidatus Limnocylindria bacterium]|nr:hypothetical protein [Candidatus Limnocylindria bacterium]